MHKDNKEELSEATIHSLILDYLRHNCYLQSIKAFQGAANLEEAREDSAIEKRRAIMEAIVEGNILGAINHVRAEFPFAFEERKSAPVQNLETDLYCQHFVECVRNNDYEQALHIAQERFKNKIIMAPYEDISSLLAYKDPNQNSLLSKYMEPARKTELCFSVDRRIRGKFSRLTRKAVRKRDITSGNTDSPGHHDQVVQVEARLTTSSINRVFSGRPLFCGSAACCAK